MIDETVSAKLAQLRQHMQAHNLDFYLITSTDPHRNEYVPECWQRRAWISEFDGSAGDVLVGMDWAYLWTDGRYEIQAQRQLDSQLFKIYITSHQGTLSIEQWLMQQPQSFRCGVDPKVINIKQARRFQKKFKEKNSELCAIETNLVDLIWRDRQPLPKTPVEIQSLKYTGMSSAEKFAVIRNKLKEHHCDAIIISALDSIAWTMNIRGKDIAYNPLTIAYAIISETQVLLFIDKEKITAEDQDYFREQKVEIKDYEDIQDELNQFRRKIWLDSQQTSWWIQQQLKQAQIFYSPSPISLMKAIKNSTEQQGMREAHYHDAKALIQFFAWLENNWRNKISEIDAEEKLKEFRMENPQCRDLSFRTISGFGDHSAIIHYSAAKATQYMIDDQSIYLIDSGGQYFAGTTDVTRTIHLGNPSEREKIHYTLVLKGHLALRHSHFPAGTTGEQLNAIARWPLWQSGCDYPHGTGHGVGCYLCVHESPPSISGRFTGVALKPGMIVSNEPGVYYAGQFGIRIENLCLVVESDGNFYTFEDLTLVPYARNLIEVSLLNDEEIKWINEYHQKIDDLFSNACTAETREWLKKATEKITRS